MSIEADAQKDLALSAEDAANVMGGKKTPKKQRAAAHAAAAPRVAGPPIRSQDPTNPGLNSAGDDQIGRAHV